MSKIQGSAFIQPIKDGSGALATTTLQTTANTSLSSIDNKLTNVATAVKQDRMIELLEGLDLTGTGLNYVWTTAQILAPTTLDLTDVPNGTNSEESNIIDLGANYSHPVKPFYQISVNNGCTFTVQLLGSFDREVDEAGNEVTAGTFIELDQPYSETLDNSSGKMYSLNDVAVPRFYKIKITIDSIADPNTNTDVTITHGAWLKPVPAP